MSRVFDTLQNRYQALIARREQGEMGEDFLEDVRAFIADTQRAGAAVADVNERSQLRAWMRFLAIALHEATGIQPDTTLQPLARGQLIGLQPQSGAKPSRSCFLGWMLLGGAAVVIIAVGLVVLSRLLRAGLDAAPASAPAPTPFVIHLAVGAELGEGGVLEAADTFCYGISEIVAEIAFEDIGPETSWRWEVRGDGEIVSRQSTAQWGEEEQERTITILTGRGGKVGPGTYELRVYAGGQVAGVRTFRVLDVAPHVSTLRVADVPQQGEGAVGTAGFDAGVRVIYLDYVYEGFCPGLEVSHVLHRDGEPIWERTAAWSGGPAGSEQVTLQAPRGLPFPPGEYEVAVRIRSEERGRQAFAIREGLSAAFGEITVAQGVMPDGTPILTSQDDSFDWNTKSVYAIFDYVGMSDGLRWTAIWMRDDEEVSRQAHFWDGAAVGTTGTHWVAYYDESTWVLPEGSYTVTLHIEDEVQSTASFEIIRYTPPGE